jgi:hypothetical protein
MLPITQSLSTMKLRVHSLCCSVAVGNGFQVVGEKMYDKGYNSEYALPLFFILLY